VIQRRLRVKETELEERIWPFIAGRVFHVTRSANVASILQAGGISPNKDGTFPSTFGSADNSFFRKRGCVSVFDLAHPTPEDIQVHLCSCWPLQTARPGSGIAIFILASAACKALVSWERWKEEDVVEQMVVPYVEAGFHGFLDLDRVAELIVIEVEEVPGSIQAMHRNLMLDKLN